MSDGSQPKAFWIKTKTSGFIPAHDECSSAMFSPLQCMDTKTLHFLKPCSPDIKQGSSFILCWRMFKTLAKVSLPQGENKTLSLHARESQKLGQNKSRIMPLYSAQVNKRTGFHPLPPIQKPKSTGHHFLPEQQILQTLKGLGCIFGRERILKFLLNRKTVCHPVLNVFVVCVLQTQMYQ